MKAEILNTVLIMTFQLTGFMIIQMTSTSFNVLQAQPDVERIIEEVTPYTDEDVDPEILGESLHALADHPVNINAARRSDLQCIPFLSEGEITRILSFRDQHGYFLSSYELFLIPALDSSKVTLLLPFLKIQPDRMVRDTLSLFRNLITTSRKFLMIRYARSLSTKAGYLNTNDPQKIRDGQYFTGSPNYIYGRFEMHEENDFDLGLTFEKDAGEPFFFKPAMQYFGFDHYAGYFRLLDRGFLKSLTIGDYQAHFGEGLVMGRGLMFKGSGSLGFIRNRYSGIHPYQGAMESMFMRGIALTLGSNNLDLTLFGSRKMLDARMYESSGITASSGISQTGYHRTPDEIGLKQNLREYATGGNLGYIFGNLKLEGSFLYNHWQYPLRPSPEYYTLLDFRGDRHFSGSVSYNFSRGKFSIFGESAVSKGRRHAHVQGIIANLLPEFEIAVHLRYFSPEYYSKYGRTFSEYSELNNEKGVFWGIQIQPLTRLKIRAYYDIYRSDWPRYNMASPSTGKDFMIRILVDPGAAIKLEGSYKQETKPRNVPGLVNSPLLVMKKGIKKNYRLQIKIPPLDLLHLSTILQGSGYAFNNSNSYGWCFAQDVSIIKNKYSIRSRIAYFNVDDYYNRQYLYEHDVLYAFSINALNGQGVRGYVQIKYSPWKFLDIWLKSAITRYSDRDHLGSGINRIEGNKKVDFKCQVRLKF